MGLGNFFSKLGDIVSDIEYSLTAYTDEELMKELDRPESSDSKFSISDEKMDIIMEWISYCRRGNDDYSDNNNSNNDDDECMVCYRKSEVNLQNEVSSNNIIDFNSYKSKRKVRRKDKNNDK